MEKKMNYKFNKNLKLNVTINRITILLFQISATMGNLFSTKPTIIVSDSCLESNPCKHDVVVNGKKYEWLTGIEIYKLYVENNMVVPQHFLRYKKRVEKMRNDKV